MKKRLAAILTVALSVFCLSGCGDPGTLQDASEGMTKEEGSLAGESEQSEALVSRESEQSEEPVSRESEQEQGSSEAADGTYDIDVTLGGGSGKSTVLSPATITITGKDMVARIEWSSPNYDYMIVDGEKYLSVNTEGNSVFEIPVSALDTELDVTADTVAMSKPKEIEYTLTFHSDTMKPVE